METKAGVQDVLAEHVAQCEKLIDEHKAYASNAVNLEMIPALVILAAMQQCSRAAVQQCIDSAMQQCSNPAVQPCRHGAV